MRTTITALSVLAVTASALAGTTPIQPKQIIGSGLVYPTWIGHAPGDETRLFVLEKAGRVRIIDLGATPTLRATAFLNIDPIVAGGASTSDEQGLLGMAFDPDYATNGQFYVYYTGSGTNNLARYTVSADPNVANATGVVMMTWSDPYTNHNGGDIHFKPGTRDLYMGTGDGGSANDPGNVAQNLSSRLGKMHRITPTVGGAAPYYTIPASNPFFGGATTADDTVWSYGLRNPWRWCFDRENSDMYIADVGQNAVEEVNYEPNGAAAGRNYGWRCTEGTSNTGLTGCTFGSPTLTAPVRTYGHNSSGGYSITGGRVYRGCAMPDMQGIYFYVDYSTNNSWSMRMVNGVVTEFVSRNSELRTAVGGQTVNQVVAFGEDAKGELYMADHGGQIYKIIPAAGEVVCPTPNPNDLNNDGLVDGADLGILLGNWGGSGAGDIDNSGTVDGADLGILLGGWGA